MNKEDEAISSSTEVAEQCVGNQDNKNFLSGNRQSDTAIIGNDGYSEVTKDQTADQPKSEPENIETDIHIKKEIIRYEEQQTEVNTIESHDGISVRAEDSSETKLSRADDYTETESCRKNDQIETRLDKAYDQTGTELCKASDKTETEPCTASHQTEIKLCTANDQTEAKLCITSHQTDTKLCTANSQSGTELGRAKNQTESTLYHTENIKKLILDRNVVDPDGNQITSSHDVSELIETIDDAHECLDPRCPQKLHTNFSSDDAHFGRYKPMYRYEHDERTEISHSHHRSWRPGHRHNSSSNNLSDLQEALDLSIPKHHEDERPLVFTMEKNMGGGKMFVMDLFPKTKPASINKSSAKKRRARPGGDIKDMQDLYKDTVDMPTSLPTPRSEFVIQNNLISRNIPLRQEMGFNARPQHSYINIENSSNITRSQIFPHVPKLLNTDRQIEQPPFINDSQETKPNNAKSVVTIQRGVQIQGGPPIQGGISTQREVPIQGGLPIQGGISIQGGVSTQVGVPIQGGISTQGGVPIQGEFSTQRQLPIQGEFSTQPLVVCLVPGSLTIPVKTRSDFVKLAPRHSADHAVQPNVNLHPIRQDSGQTRPIIDPVTLVSNQVMTGTIPASTVTPHSNQIGVPITESWIGTPQVDWNGGQTSFRSMQSSVNEIYYKPKLVIKGQGKQISTYMICNTCMSHGKTMTPFVNGFTLANHVCKFHHVMRNITGPQFHFTMHTNLVNYNCIPVVQEKIFPCKYGNCLRKFTSIKSLKDHIVECHAKDLKVYVFKKCQYRNCERIFPTHQLRKQHVKEFHLEHRIKAEDNYGALWLVKTTLNTEISAENKERLERNHEEAFKEMRNFFSRTYILQRFKVTSGEYFTSFCESCDYQNLKEEAFDPDKHEKLASYEKEISVANLCEELKNSGGDFVIDINNVKSRMLDGGIIIHNEHTGCCVYIDDGLTKGNNSKNENHNDIDDISPITSPSVADADNSLPDKDIVENIKPKDVEMDVGDLVFLYGKPDPNYAPSGLDDMTVDIEDKEQEEETIKTETHDQLDTNMVVDNGESRAPIAIATTAQAHEDHTNEYLDRESINMLSNTKNELSIKCETYWDVIGNETINKSLHRFKTGGQLSRMDTNDETIKTQVDGQSGANLESTVEVVKEENIEKIPRSTSELTIQADCKKDQLQSWTDEEVGQCISIPDSYADVDNILETFSGNVKDIEATSLFGENIKLDKVSKNQGKLKKKRKKTKKVEEELITRKAFSDSDDDIIELDIESESGSSDMCKTERVQKNEEVVLDVESENIKNLSLEQKSLDGNNEMKVNGKNVGRKSTNNKTEKMQHSKKGNEKFKLGSRPSHTKVSVEGGCDNYGTESVQSIPIRNRDVNPIVNKDIRSLENEGTITDKQKVYHRAHNRIKTEMLNEKIFPEQFESENYGKMKVLNKSSIEEKWKSGEDSWKVKKLNKSSIPEKVQSKDMLERTSPTSLKGERSDFLWKSKIFDRSVQIEKSNDKAGNINKNSPPKVPHFSTARAWNFDKLKKLKMLNKKSREKIEKSPTKKISKTGNKVSFSKTLPKSMGSVKSHNNDQPEYNDNLPDLNNGDDGPPKLEMMETHLTVDSVETIGFNEKLPTLSLDGVTFEDRGCQIKPCSVKLFKLDDNDIQYICDQIKAGYRTEYANYLFTMHKQNAHYYDQLVSGEKDISRKPWKRKRILQVCKDMFEMKKYFSDNPKKSCSEKDRKKKHKLATKRRKFVDDVEWIMNTDSDSDTISYDSDSEKSDVSVGEENHFVCPDIDCNRKFCSSVALERHMVRVHGDEDYCERKLCPVDECARSYTNKYTLMNHIKKDHGEDVYNKIRVELYGAEPKSTSPEPAVVRPAGTCLMPTVWRTPKLLIPPQVTVSKPSPTQPPKNVKEVEDIKNILSDLTQNGSGTFFSILSNK